MAQGLSTPDPSLSPTHLSIRRGRETTTHYTHHQVSLVVSRNTTLVPSLGLRIGPACEAGLSAGMQRERVTPNKKERKKVGDPVSDTDSRLLFPFPHYSRIWGCASFIYHCSYSHWPICMRLGNITDVNKIVNSQHFGSEPADIRILISDHFCLRLDTLAEVCAL